MTLLVLSDVRRTYVVGKNRVPALRGIDLSIEAGEFVAIMGASGSGKTTLLNVIGILDPYDEGEYRLDGVLVKGWSERRAAQHRSRTLGFVFQSFNLIPFKTAAENVALPLYYQGVGRKKRNRVAIEYLDRVGLADRANHLPGELSGGQQQRVAIARALVSQPKVVLADEPTGALDSATSREIVDLLREIHESGVTVVIVTHEAEVSGRTDRVVRLRDGRIEDDRRQAHV